MATPNSSGALGTGLSAPVLAALFGISVLAFLLWDGPLWLAPVDRTHTGRLALSYGIVMPGVALAQALARSFSWSRWISAVGVVWGAKMLVTALVFSFLSPGTARRYNPAKPWAHAPDAPSGTHSATPAAGRSGAPTQ